MSCMESSATLAGNGGIMALKFDEIDLVGGADGTLKDGLQDAAAAAAVVSGAAALGGAVPVAVGAAAVGAVCLLASAFVD